MPNKDIIIHQTIKWLETFIIKHTICPFAKREFDKNSIHYEVILEPSLEQQLEQLILACNQLDNNSDIETTLVIYPKGLDDFDDYLDFLYLANELMIKQGYEGVYQLASFHPDYCFDGVDEEDASNYTNRSPYPMLHLIKEVSLEQALLNTPNPENIPIRNVEYTRKMGLNVLRKILSDCF